MCNKPNIIQILLNIGSGSLEHVKHTVSKTCSIFISNLQFPVLVFFSSWFCYLFFKQLWFRFYSQPIPCTAFYCESMLNRQLSQRATYFYHRSWQLSTTELKLKTIPNKNIKHIGSKLKPCGLCILFEELPVIPNVMYLVFSSIGREYFYTKVWRLLHH